MAPSPETIIAAFEQSGIIPVFYHDDENVCLEVLQACYDGGLRVFEFTSRGENARKNFATLRDRKLAAMPDLYLGIGTIKNASDAAVYAGMGADFIVCPVTDPETAAYCSAESITWIPGCMTPTEISVAEKSGARLVKLADKICNLRDILSSPPADWSQQRKQAYFEWAGQVVNGVRGVNGPLEAIFDELQRQASSL